MSQLFVITLPGPVRPLERTFRYGLPADQALREAGLGRVVGEHTWVELGSDDHFHVVGATIEVELVRPEESLVLLRRLLVEAGAPAGTVISEACALCDGIGDEVPVAAEPEACDRAALPVRARWPGARPISKDVVPVAGRSAVAMCA